MCIRDRNAYCDVGSMCTTAPMHDAHPVAYVLDPTMYPKPQVMRMSVLVGRPGDAAHGLSLVDRRSGAPKRIANTPPVAGECDVTVLLEVDGRKFRAALMSAASELRRAAAGRS